SIQETGGELSKLGSAPIPGSVNTFAAIPGPLVSDSAGPEREDGNPNHLFFLVREYNARVMKRIALPVCVLILLTSCVWLLAQEWQQKATLLTDASESETVLWLDRSGALSKELPLLIEAPDGAHKEVYELVRVWQDHALLKEPLRKSYGAGSRLFQEK
ncbi:MAG: hypothetical protein ACE5JX_05945, partial [Acidobacteriota bacterium]